MKVNDIVIEGARENNLRNVNVRIPKHGRDPAVVRNR